MKETKRRLETFSFYDRTGLEAHLAKMAAQGWLLEKIGQFLWTYRRVEPKTLTFSVCYFPKASAFDPEPSEEQETFYDFCEHTGWTLAASSAQLQVFYNERKKPIPIETDPVLEVDAVHRSVKKSVLPSLFLMLAMGLLNGGLWVWRLMGDPIGVLSTPANLFTGMCWVIVLLLVGVELGSYFLWHHRAVRAAERGEFYRTRSHRKLQIGCLVVLFAGLVWFFLSVATSGSRRMAALTVVMFGAYTPLVFLSVFGVKALLKRMKVRARISLVVTIVTSIVVCYAFVGVVIFGVLFGSNHGWFNRDDEETYEYYGHTWTVHHDELPLTVEGLLDVPDQEGYSRERDADESLLLARYDCRQQARFDAPDHKTMPELNYVITVVKVPALYDLCREQLLHDRDHWNDGEPEGNRNYYQSVDPAPWGALEAYQWVSQNYGESYMWNTFLLCYEDRFVAITFHFYRFDEDWVPTPAQMAVVGERLGDGDDLPGGTIWSASTSCRPGFQEQKDRRN